MFYVVENCRKIRQRKMIGLLDRLRLKRDDREQL